MEPQSLEQLLDCPVCFERLDGSNRVLPCQHTFCKKCLEKVKSEFKELRCPECRTKYNGSVNDLHCNILVMRILEQIKQSEKEGQKTAKKSNIKTKTDAKSSVPNNERKNHVNHVVGSSSVSAFIGNPSGIYSRYRTSSTRAETGATAQVEDRMQTLSNNINLSSGNRVILGATRKQIRNRDDNARNSLTFARSFVSSSNPNVEPVPHSVRGNEGSTFSPSSYTFTVELKTSDRSSNGSRRTHKNYVKPSILNAFSNSDVIITGPINLFDNFSAANTNVMTPSTSQCISVSHNEPKNYLSFSPGSYTFNVNLKPCDRGSHKKKNYLS